MHVFLLWTANRLCQTKTASVILIYTPRVTFDAIFYGSSLDTRHIRFYVIWHPTLFQSEEGRLFDGQFTNYPSPHDVRRGGRRLASVPEGSDSSAFHRDQFVRAELMPALGRMTWRLSNDAALLINVFLITGSLLWWMAPMSLKKDTQSLYDVNRWRFPMILDISSTLVRVCSTHAPMGRTQHSCIFSFRWLRSSPVCL